jgi:tetratricopeptide (TPR) repeat protein
MSSRTRNRLIRLLDRAEGYLMLDMPEPALAILQGRDGWGAVQFEASFLTGEALRALGRYRDALKPLELAESLRPGHLGVAISLGWCYKRTHRLAQAIDAIQRAARENPDEPLLHYNLACYWSLAGDPERAIEELASALDLDPDLQSRIADELDFQALRDHEAFGRLVSGQAPSA